MQDDLDRIPEYNQENDVVVFENKEENLGVYSIIKHETDIEVIGITIEKGNWLEHQCIAPKHIGKGVGKKLFSNLCRVCKEKGLTEINRPQNKATPKYWRTQITHTRIFIFNIALLIKNGETNKST